MRSDLLKFAAYGVLLCAFRVSYPAPPGGGLELRLDFTSTNVFQKIYSNGDSRIDSNGSSGEGFLIFGQPNWDWSNERVRTLQYNANEVASYGITTNRWHWRRGNPAQGLANLYQYDITNSLPYIVTTNASPPEKWTPNAVNIQADDVGVELFTGVQTNFHTHKQTATYWAESSYDVPVRMHFRATEVKLLSYSIALQDMVVAATDASYLDDVVFGASAVDCNYETDIIVPPNSSVDVTPTISGLSNYSVGGEYFVAPWYDMSVHKHPNVTASINDIVDTLQSSMDDALDAMAEDHDGCVPQPTIVTNRHCDDARGFRNAWVHQSASGWPSGWNGNDYYNVIKGSDAHRNLGYSSPASINVINRFTDPSGSYLTAAATAGLSSSVTIRQDSLNTRALLHEWGHVLGVRITGGHDSEWHRPLSPACHIDGVMWWTLDGSESEINWESREDF